MTTLEEAKAEIARLRTDGLPWRIKLDVHDPNRGALPAMGFESDTGLEIVVAWSPVDVDTGDNNVFKLHLLMQAGESVLDAGRRAIRVIALHEIDEQLTVDGVRRWEPHLVAGTHRTPVLRRVEWEIG